MIFKDIPTGESVFVDANTFIYYFAADPVFGPACDQLLRRIENQDILGYNSAHVLSEVAHRLMTLEASQVHGWPMTGIARRLKAILRNCKSSAGIGRQLTRLPSSACKRSRSQRRRFHARPI